MRRRLFHRAMLVALLVLVSDGLEFADCQVLPDPVSDHRGVVAELRLRQAP